jgi:hypothetical protein
MVQNREMADLHSFRQDTAQPVSNQLVIGQDLAEQGHGQGIIAAGVSH